MWAWIVTFVVGFIVGLIARALMPGTQSMGFFLTGILGVVGAFVGGLINGLFKGTLNTTGIDSSGWIMSVIGAIVVLFAYQFLQKK